MAKTADDAVDEMLRANDGKPEDTARILLRQLLGGGHHNVLLGAPGTELLTSFLEEHRTLPTWANRELVEHAQALGRKHLVVGSVLLAVASLATATPRAPQPEPSRMPEPQEAPMPPPGEQG